MDEWELERQRQINLQNLRREEAERQNKYGTLEGNLLEAIFKLIGLAISLTFIVVVAILKWTFFFVIFLRNRFFLKWNWYIKTEIRTHSCHLFRFGRYFCNFRNDDC